MATRTLSGHVDEAEEKVILYGEHRGLCAAQVHAEKKATECFLAGNDADAAAYRKLAWELNELSKEAAKKWRDHEEGAIGKQQVYIVEEAIEWMYEIERKFIQELKDDPQDQELIGRLEIIREFLNKANVLECES